MFSTSFPSVKKSVFIITYGRSGSTLLQNMLNSIPGYLIRGENDNILAPLAQAWNIVRQSDQGHKMRTLGRVTTSKDPWFGYEEVTDRKFGHSLANIFTQNVLRPDNATRAIGFKEVRWHVDPVLFPVMLNFLLQFFPDARFIFNTRDHDQVVRSGWWKQMQEDAVRNQLSEAEILYSNFSTHLPECCISLHYNDYTIGVDAWRPLFEFLEEPFDAGRVAAVLDQKLWHMKNHR